MYSHILMSCVYLKVIDIIKLKKKMKFCRTAWTNGRVNASLESVHDNI